MTRFSRTICCCAILLCFAEQANAQIAFTRVREDVTKPGDYRLDAEIWIVDGDGSNPRRLTHNTTDDYGTAWSPDGKTIAFGAVQFIPDSTGALKPGTARIYTIDANGGEQVLITPPALRAQFPSWADNGRITFHGGKLGDRETLEIFTMNSDGTDLVQLTNNTWSDARPEWSPDGKRIAFQSNRSGDMEIYVMNADGSRVTKLTDSGKDASSVSPSWSAENDRIVFQSDRDGNLEIYVMNSDGTEPTRVTHYEGRAGDPEWTTDGRIIFDREIETDGKVAKQMYMINPDGTGATALTAFPSSNSHAAWKR